MLHRLLDLFTKGTRRHLWRRVGTLQRSVELHSYMRGDCGHDCCPHPDRFSWFHARFRGRAHPCVPGCPLDRDIVRAGRVWAAWRAEAHHATAEVNETYAPPEAVS